MEEIKALLAKLTTDDLRAWAGAKIFSRGKSYIGNVDGLSRTDDGALAAWVSGSDAYATTVGLDPEGDLEYFCTCPYDDGPCKHAVAVILAAAEQVKRKRDIPLLEEDDDLYLALFEDSEDDFEDDGYDGYDDDDDWLYQDDEPEKPKKSAAAQKKANAQVAKILDGMSKEELAATLLDLTSRYPEVERGILEKQQLATGQVDKLVSSLRREIRNLTAEPAWYNHWNGDGSIPDYSHVQQQLQALLAKGHADAVLELGGELWTRGNQQVEESDDEGDTASAIAQCLQIVLRALPQTSLTPPKQLLWLIERELEDDYSLLESSDKVMKGKAYTQAHWADVAQVLQTRLNSIARPPRPDFSDTYRREKVVDMLQKAYERSGQKDRIISLWEREAEACQSYGKLVEALLAAGEREKARQWCIDGYNRTIESAPGTASGLQRRLREMAQQEKRLDLVAAYRAEEFFDHASRQGYTELRKAAEKAKHWPPVREAVLRYLETGRRPDLEGRGKETTSWPLPAPEVRQARKKAAQWRDQFPDLSLLIGIAIQEKRLDDAVALYGELKKTKRYSFETDKEVAEAVSGTHPQVSLGIWRAIADSLIGQVKPKAYEEAAVYLRRMRKVYQESKRDAEWLNLLGELRREHKAKRRLLEVLDALAGKKLLD